MEERYDPVEERYDPMMKVRSSGRMQNAPPYVHCKYLQL